MSEYSTNILKVNEVRRLDEKNFECILSEVNMLGKTIQPKLFIEVDVGDIVRFNVTSMSLISNDKFIETMSKDSVFVDSGVKLYEKIQGEDKLMWAEVFADVKIIIPRFLPFGKQAIQSSGNLAINTILNQALRLFMVSLEKDYQAWARDDPSR